MVYPLYSPQSFIAEGSANYGVELAFPGDERLDFETRVLYPLAGLPDDGRRHLSRAAGGDARRWPAPASPSPATCSKAGSRATQAIELAQRYQLVTPRRGPSNRSPSPSITAPM